MLVALALLALSVAGCRSPIGTWAADPTVGTLVQSWSQAQDEERPGVERLAPDFVGGRLITTEGAWKAFRQKLPASLRTQAARRALARVDLRDSVVVIGSYGKCTEVSSIIDHGDGTLEFHVEGDPDTNCAWSPQQLEVWQVPLAETGADRSDVHLVDGDS